MTKPLVTIGISTYNRADGYLRPALESALAQTYPNLEIVVSDNASTDATQAYIESFSDPRIRFFKQKENLGANGNFNFCLDQARGAFFLLLHDDDILDPDFVKACMSAVGDDVSVGVVRTGVRVIDDKGRVIYEKANRMHGKTTTELFVDWFNKGTPIYYCSTLFNTEHLRAAGGLRTRTNVFDDVISLAKLSARHGHADVLEPKTNFRVHGSNRGSDDLLKAWAEDSLYLLEVLRRELPEDAELLTREGRPYLCMRCYRYASMLPTAKERWQAYWWAYQLFGFSYSPLSYLAKQQALNLKSVARTVIKGQPASAA